MIDLIYTNQTIYNYLRHILDTAGYNATEIYKAKEDEGVTFPFVLYSYQSLPIPGLIVTTQNADCASHSRALVSINVIGKQTENNPFLVETIASLLHNKFFNQNNEIYKIGDVKNTVGLAAGPVTKTQSYEASFQAMLTVINEIP